MKSTLFALALLAAASCKGSDSTSSEAAAGSAAAGAAAAAAATAAADASPPFVSAAGRYTAKVTFGPVTESTAKDPNGATWQVAKWVMRKGLFMVQYTDYADAATAKAETMVGFIPTRDKAAIKRDEPIKVGAREGRDIVWMANETLTMHTRFIIDGKRVYKLGAGNKGDRETVEKFFDGFQINAGS